MITPRSLELNMLMELSRFGVYPENISFDGQCAWVPKMRRFKALKYSRRV